MGSCTAGGAYVPAMSDENVIVREQGTIFLGGPPLVKAATGETVTAEELGGGEIHSSISGVADHLAENDTHALSIGIEYCIRLEQEKYVPVETKTVLDPFYSGEELYGVIPPDNRQRFMTVMRSYSTDS